MKLTKQLVCGLAGLMFVLASQTAQGQFDPLLKWVPDDANSLVMVRAEEIFKSPLAKEQKWLQEYTAAYEAGMEFLPTAIERYVIASQIDYQFMEPLWTVSVYERKGDEIDLTKATERIGGNLDLLTGFEAINLRSDVYLVKIAKNLAASMAPANRQNTIRWLQTQANSAPKHSKYLEQAANFAEENADVIIAFDLENVMSEEDVRTRLAQFECVEPAECEAGAKILSSLQGVTLGITVNDKISGSIKVDFAMNPVAIQAKAKQILLEALGNRGMMIDDFENWELQHSGNQFRLAGPLSREGLRSISLLVSHPIKNAIGFGGSTVAGGTATEPNAGTRSKQYFDSIMTIVEDFRKKPEYKNLNTYAVWFDRYARKVDEISVINVDEELLKFGQTVSDTFRDVANSLRGSELQKTEQVTQFQDYSYSGRYGRWGSYSEHYSNARNRNIAASTVRQRGANTARETLEDIAKEAGRLRKEMSTKYGINF